MLINKTEISVSGRVVRIVRVRHEWFEFLDNPPAFIEELRRADVADIVTFLQEAHVERTTWPYLQQTTHASVLSFRNFDDWWRGLKDKARNQARKAQKTGVDLRPARLDDEFLSGVKDIYDPEQNIRAGAHYLSDLLTRFDSNLELALAAYNAGEEAVERYGRHVPPFRETMSYVPSVMKVYQRLLDQAHAS